MHTVNIRAGLVRGRDALAVPRSHRELNGAYWVLCDETRTMDLSSVGGMADAKVTGTLYARARARRHRWSVTTRHVRTPQPMEDRMRNTIITAVLVIGLFVAACSPDSPTTPRMLGSTRAALGVGGTTTHAIPLVAVLGTGSGAVNVSPTAEDQGTFHVQGEVHIVRAAPRTTYLVQRAPDLNVADPSCTGPWISFPFPNAGPVVTLTTSPAGAGAAHFELGVGGAFTSGTPFNVRFRVIDALQNPTSILMSDCVTVVVK